MDMELRVQALELERENLCKQAAAAPCTEGADSTNPTSSDESRMSGAEQQMEHVQNLEMRIAVGRRLLTVCCHHKQNFVLSLLRFSILFNAVSKTLSRRSSKV